MSTADRDEQARAYWHASAASDESALTRIAYDPDITWELLEATVTDAHRIGPHVAQPVIALAAANPATGADRAWRWARGTEDPDVAAGALLAPFARHGALDGALTNPHNGTRVEELAEQHGHTAISSLLANSAAPTSFIDRYTTLFATTALAHPNCSPEHLINPAGHAYTEALANPALPTELAWAALTQQHPTADVGRRRAARHPGLSNDQLKALLDDEERRPHGDQRLIAAISGALGARAWVVDPGTRPALHLRLHTGTGRRATIAERICDLNPVQRSAIRSLLNAEFAGTVNELLDVAATF